MTAKQNNGKLKYATNQTRTNAGYSLDRRIIEAVTNESKARTLSRSAIVEEILAAHYKIQVFDERTKVLMQIKDGEIERLRAELTKLQQQVKETLTQSGRSTQQTIEMYADRYTIENG